MNEQEAFIHEMVVAGNHTPDLGDFGSARDADRFFGWSLAISSGHACQFAIDHGGNIYRRYNSPQCAAHPQPSGSVSEALPDQPVVHCKDGKDRPQIWFKWAEVQAYARAALKQSIPTGLGAQVGAREELALIEAVLKGFPESMARNDALRACKKLAATPPSHEAREPLNLGPTIAWLEGGCDPLAAAKELRRLAGQPGEAG